MPSLPRHLLTILTLGLVTLFVGCEAKGPQRYDHWGQVTYKGRPVPKGIMYFDPDLGAKQDGPQGFAEITDGAYDTRNRPDSGPGSGKYMLRIYAADGVAGPEAPMGKPLFVSEVMISRELPAEPGELQIEIPENAR